VVVVVVVAIGNSGTADLQGAGARAAATPREVPAKAAAEGHAMPSAAVKRAGNMPRSREESRRFGATALLMPLRQFTRRVSNPPTR